MYNDASGPSKRTGLSTSFAYHVKTEGIKLSFGLSGSVTQFSIDRVSYYEVPGDIAVMNGVSHVIADANFGILWKETAFYWVSGFNLLENPSNINALTTPVNNSLDHVFYAHAGYNFRLGLSLIPTFYFRYI